MVSTAVAKRKGRGAPNPAKIKSVDSLKDDLKKYQVVGLLNMHKMPAAQLQEMRLKIGERGKIITIKKSVILHALESAGGKVRDLETYLVKPQVQPAFLFSEMNPFVLFKFLEQNKSEAPSKAGDLAPRDILIKAGDTGLPPGPAIGTLSQVGLKAKVVSGKIHVMENRVIAKTGEAIKPEVVNVLNMLNIKPMEIGLDLIAAYEDGLVYDKSVLRIDEVAFTASFNTAITAAINLSLNCGYITKQTAELAIRKAYGEARAVAVESGAYEKGAIEELLAKHAREYVALKATVPDQTPQEQAQTEEKKP